MDKKLLAKIKELKEDDPFLITVTVFSKNPTPGKQLDSFIFVNNFPYDELEGTKEAVADLIEGAKKK
jgi:hypothetical protein